MKRLLFPMLLMGLPPSATAQEITGVPVRKFAELSAPLSELANQRGHQQHDNSRGLFEREVPVILAEGEQELRVQPTSLYSDVDIKKCQQLALFEDEGEGGEWLCKGIKDHDVRIWEGDLRSFVGFGKMAPMQCASTQTFGAFNSLGPRVEWRMKDGKPFATILRWLTESTADPDAPVKQNWLVVTKLAEKEACHIAYIDTKYAEANEVARQRADEKAATFDCAEDMPEIFSARGGIATDYASGMPCPGGPYREE